MSEKDHAAQSAARKAWEERKVAPALKRGPERKKEFRTTSGIDIERIYDPSNLDGIDYARDLGYPGAYPFTRGVQPTMYRGRFWTMRQYAGFGTAEESNQRYRYLFEQGQTGLSVAFDLPTQMGRDAPRARSAASAYRSARSPTWRRCWADCRWTKSRPR
jgi:methylmalonyl-CoA mutase N-terminal domain/subunit